MKEQVCVLYSTVSPTCVCLQKWSLSCPAFFFVLSFLPARVSPRLLICLSSVNTKDQSLCFVFYPMPGCQLNASLHLRAPPDVFVFLHLSQFQLGTVRTLLHCWCWEMSAGMRDGTHYHFWQFLVFRICEWFTCLHLSWWWWWWCFLHFVSSLIL